MLREHETTGATYSRLSIGLHWFMLLLLVGIYATIELRELFPRGSDPREAMKAWHFMLGLSVLAFLACRLVARLAGSTPPIVPAPARWQHVVARAAHAALYLFLLAMPILGWLALSAEGDAISLFGLPVPPLLPLDAANLSPQARAFYSENRRVSNLKAKRLLGWRPRYPTFREGLADCIRRFSP